MKKIRSAEFLAAVAIVTSATVMQIREHMQVHEAPAANPNAALSWCGATHDGLVLAACEPTRGELQPDQSRGAKHWRSAAKMWV